jgi:CelD/BcsL family acetyltransferase involved in cellulose biosynthesis
VDTLQTIDPLRDSRWDAFVADHPFGWVCHLSGWKKVLEETFPHMRGHYLAIVSADNEITAALPLVEVRSWLTGHRLVSLPFATLSDPLIQSPVEFHTLAGEAIALARRLGARSFTCRTHRAAALVSDERFGEVRSFKHHFLSLEKGTDALMKSFDRTCVRQRLGRAAKSGLRLLVVRDEAQLSAFYGLYVGTRKHLGLPPQPYGFLRSLWTTFAPSGAVEVLMAELEGRPVAGVLLLKYRDRVSVEYSVHDERYRNLSPVHFLFWEAMKMSMAAGYRIFDLGRTAGSNASLMDFKKRWGMEVVDLPEFHYPGRNVTARPQDRESAGTGLVRKVVRLMPASLLPAIGKLCYRHLG